MPRPFAGPRLYLDPSRKQWVIRNGHVFIRTGFGPEEKEQAEARLAEYVDKPHKPTTQESVYFLRCGRMVKIGRALDVQKRIRTLQNSSPRKITLLWAQSGGSDLELRYHREFKECRSHGEWFEIRGKLEVFLSELGIKK